MNQPVILEFFQTNKHKETKKVSKITLFCKVFFFVNFKCPSSLWCYTTVMFCLIKKKKKKHDSIFKGKHSSKKM